ncbi:SHOCT domain-containing protein [Curtobacterium citreum]
MLTADGLAEQIQKLADLRAAGVLSDDEFASAKARLIAQ